MAATLKKALSQQLASLQGHTVPQLIDLRYKRLVAYGV
jgi:acetyl-CoA carboxylase alpha subunit